MNFVNNVRNMFKLTPVASASKQAADAASGLYEEQATDLLVQMLTRMPDMDEVLRQAGIKREKLRVLLTDDEIGQACETRCDALLATPFRLEPSEGAGADLLMEILKPVIQDAISASFKARLFGYSVMEAVYEQRPDGKIGLKFLGEKPMEWFEPKSDGRLVYYANDGSTGLGVELDQTYKFFMTRSRPTYSHPYGDALLTKLYWPWFFRNNGWKFWGKFLERFGSPLLVGNSSDPKKMVSALLAAHSNAVLGIGPDDKVEAVGVASGNTGQAFDGFETAVIRRIQKVVLGQTLTSGTDGGSGNRALGAVHDTVRKDKRNSDIQMITQTVQRVVDALCALNGLPKHMAVFADDVGLESDRAERDAKLYAQGVRFTPEYYQDNYDLRDEDFDMTEAPATGSDGLPLQPVPGAGGKAPPVATKKEPATPPAKGGPAAKASLSHIAFSLAAAKFTPQQQEVEDQGAAALELSGQPLDAELVRKAIFAARSPEDLADRLFTLVGDVVSREEFQEVLERSLFAADVLGYVHAEGK